MHTADTSLLIIYVSVVTLFSIITLIYVYVKHRGISRSATEKLLSHLRISREGLAIFNARRRIVFSNALFRQYCDIISSEHLVDLRHILLQPEFRTISRFVDNDTVDRTEENVHSTKIEKDGRVFLLNCARFDDGGFEISINDVTQIEEQSRLKQQLTQNVAHEFKTPVCSIQGGLETIIRNYPHNMSEEQLMHFLKRCHSQSNRLCNLVDDMSQLHAMSNSVQRMKKEIVDLSQLVNSVQHEVADRLAAQNMSVCNNLPQHLYLEGDPSLLYSIFRNLFDNAIAYAGEGTAVGLSCFRSDEQFYYFSFADNGCGVSDEHLNRIFERFYRVDKGRSRKLGGTGLGLAIVKNAVTLHNGAISARRSQEGGLEFVFTLHR